jgi:hypothetical protein
LGAATNIRMGVPPEGMSTNSVVMIIQSGSSTSISLRTAVDPRSFGSSKDAILEDRFPPMIRHAKDLSPDQKAAIESLLGRRVLEDEAISIRAIEPPALSEERKQELAGELKNYFAEVDARRKPGSPEEAEDVINEAMRSVRPAYRSHQ